jgi:hypothetical protein
MLMRSSEAEINPIRKMAEDHQLEVLLTLGLHDSDKIID